MNVSDWIISISAGAIAVLMGLLAFVANKLYDNLAEGLKGTAKASDLESLKESLEELKTEIQEQTVEIASRVSREYESADKEHHRRLVMGLELSSKQIQKLEVILRDKVLPQVEKMESTSGKVIVLEQSLSQLLAGLQRLKKPPQ